MNQSKPLITKALLAIAFVITMILSTSGLMAQPTNYCNTCNMPGYYNWCYNWSYGYVSSVSLADANTGAVSLSRSSGMDNGYIFTNIKGEVTLATAYRLNVNINGYYAWYSYWGCRVYIDYNQDGDFFDAGEFINSSNWYLYGYGGTAIPFTINFTVPQTATPGLTRMRVIGSYWMYDYGPCFNGYSYTYPPYYYYNYGYYGEAEDYVIDITAGVKDTYPGQDAILFADESYDGTYRNKNGIQTYFKKPSIFFSANQKSGSQCTFKIQGPLPSTNVVYEGLDPITGSTNIDVGNKGMEYTIEAARGSYADGTKGAFKSARGGTYKVVAYLLGSPKEKINTFYVSWDNDLACNDIISPKTNAEPKYFKYLSGQTFRVTGLFQNVGLQNVSSFNAYARYYKPNGDFMYQDSIRYNAPPSQVLRPGDRVELDFPQKRFNDVGIYMMEMNCELLSATDQDTYNDSLARSGSTSKYSFEISYEIQLQSSRVIKPAPGEVILGNRPFIPWAEFKNVGIGDASFVPAKMIIKKLPNGPSITTSIVIQDLQAGKYNTKTVNFDQITLTETGDYQATIIISAVEDEIRQDDTLTTYFTVDGGLSGTYTVGTKYAGSSRNYPSIDSAMSALYYRGVAGPTTFELTDAQYDLRSGTPLLPAWDLTSKIIGAGWDPVNRRYNTITWAPHRDMARNRGAVTINLYSGTGQGVRFGQSITPVNMYAIFKQFGTPQNANSEGYIKFDGGSQKSLRFVLYSGSNVHGSAIYLDRGAKNISIENCIIENGQPAKASNVWIPAVAYNPPNFTFQADSTGSGVDKRGYFAGVALRNSLLKFEDANFIRLDTVPCSNNVIRGNEISGFGYGVLSLGLGTLYKSTEGQFKRFYNKDNVISDNIIHDIARAGILVGFEEGSEISGNRIYSIGNGSLDAAGIMVGGNTREGILGYNAINLKISGNEISNISSPSMVHGIKIEQVRRDYQKPSGGVVYSPDIAENMIVMNNVIWGLSPTTASANQAGIHLFTERDYTKPDFMSQITTPSKPTYFTRNDYIVNNTVIISDDGGALVNSGAIVGIGLQQTSGAYLYNNALALKDNSINSNSPVASLIFYQGTMPKSGGMSSDRNAYWLGNSGGSIFRFVETDGSSNIVEAGSRNEFTTLDQWRVWTRNDLNSILGNFTNDLVLTGTDVKRMRINTIPQAPLGSILNNRGDRISAVTNDIDGNERGIAGQRFDIGAYEFSGRMYVTDLEMSSMPDPGAYRSGAGLFSDAEYIMTEAPVEVKSQIRNNGSLQQSDIKVRARIYREQPDGLYSSSPEIDQTVKVSVASTESMEVAFGLADGVGTDFTPKTYGELRSSNYTVPSQFSTMTANVTPRYKIEVSLESDQQNDNNIISKEVRFYLKKSPLKLLISTENSMVDINFKPNPTTDEIAGRLNADSLLAGMKRLGWYTDISRSRFDIDIFDRKGWEPRSVNYGMYRSILWTDGDNSAISRYQVMDLDDFLTTTIANEKKNLIIGSEEMVRRHDNSGDAANYRPDFVHGMLRAGNYSPANPLGNGVSNDGNTVIGRVVGRDLVEKIAKTKFSGDVNPYCGLMSVWTDGPGLARVAYDYVSHTGAPNNATMGVATTTLTKNVIHLGVDWRHWKDMERLLRALLDFIDNNGGTIVPVELASFDAQSVGKRVDVSWTTASELNSSRFEVERSVVSEAGLGAWEKVSEVAAAGKSSEMKNYSVSDYTVDYGMTYSYRLKMVDMDGQWKLSDEKVVTIGSEGLQLGEAKPNPASDRVVFDLVKNADANLTFELYDMNGKQLNAAIQTGDKTVTVDVRQMVSGVYTLVMRSGEVVITRQINVVK